MAKMKAASRCEYYTVTQGSTYFDISLLCDNSIKKKYSKNLFLCTYTVLCICIFHFFSLCEKNVLVLLVRTYVSGGSNSHISIPDRHIVCEERPRATSSIRCLNYKYRLERD